MTGARVTGTRATTSRLAVLLGGLLLLLTSLAAPASAASGCVEVASTSISPAVLHGGDGAVQTVTLERPAPMPFQFVSFYGGDYGYGQTATGVRVPGGSRAVSIHVAFTGGSVRQVERDLTAASCNRSVPANAVTVVPNDPRELAVQSVTLDRDTAASGETLTATVRLTVPARSRGTSVRLIPGGEGLQLTLPTFSFLQEVPAGRRSVSLPVQVSGDGLPTQVTLAASLATSVQRGDLLAVPDHLSVVAAVGTSGSSTFTVGLGRPAPTGGARVRVEVEHPDVHAAPYVTVSAGERGAVFPLRVEQYPDTRDGTVIVTYGRTDAATLFSFE